VAALKLLKSKFKIKDRIDFAGKQWWITGVRVGSTGIPTIDLQAMKKNPGKGESYATRSAFPFHRDKGLVKKSADQSTPIPKFNLN
jgi:hypothetical protein